ncbi:tRNA (adenosine(37)-N6)-threonylcarbamoyltransferase complex ATPase subunit type 1 TsaE [bacterium AH-315-P07]|nr:tRNA (adenosine(37)-N6)-threonylcarbamoyltransferase complex ATPase subunit type 1 TsaE [bacterium AH-315-P07]
MSDTTLQIETASPEQTEALGEALAHAMFPGTLIALYGDLAAGKTCLVHGIAQAFEVQEPVSSPTFTIVNEYHGTQTLYHIDLYRLTSLEEIQDLGFEEYIDHPEAICIIEWAERADELLPESRVNIRMEHLGEDQRSISIQALTPMKDGWQEALLKHATPKA